MKRTIRLSITRRDRLAVGSPEDAPRQAAPSRPQGPEGDAADLASLAAQLAPALRFASDGAPRGSARIEEIARRLLRALAGG